MTADSAADPDLIHLVPAAVRTGLGVRELLHLVLAGQLPAFVDQSDGHRRLTFRSDDLDALGHAA